MSQGPGVYVFTVVLEKRSRSRRSSAQLSKKLACLLAR